jgi:poly(3-hydroxybutyrate) depolymerase
LPGGVDPSPLVVLLHGDAESARTLFDAWAPAAEARGFAVLAPMCPREAGCDSRSWWRWNGSPSWLLDQVGALSDRRALDPERMWIIGWSGGASYVGFRTQEFERSFAAIVVHGGGMPPARAGCSSSPASVYFLVGDANPLHALAVQLRDYYEDCHHAVTWTLLHGADHRGEWRALASHRDAILDWLATKRLVHPAAEEAPAASADAQTAAPVPVTATTASASPQVATSSPASHAACRCSIPGPESPAHRDAAAWLLLFGGAVAARQRRSGRTPSTR